MLACPDLGQNPRLDVVQPLLRGFLDAILLDPAPRTAQKRSNVGASPELSKRSSRRQKRSSICRCTNARLLCQMVAPCMLPEGAQPHRFQSVILDNVMTYERAAAPGVSSCERSASVQLAGSTRHQNLISLPYVILPSTDVQLSPYVLCSDDSACLCGIYPRFHHPQLSCLDVHHKCLQRPCPPP